jgi:hypothetical protein
MDHICEKFGHMRFWQNFAKIFLFAKVCAKYIQDRIKCAMRPEEKNAKYSSHSKSCFSDDVSTRQFPSCSRLCPPPARCGKSSNDWQFTPLLISPCKPIFDILYFWPTYILTSVSSQTRRTLMLAPLSRSTSCTEVNPEGAGPAHADRPACHVCHRHLRHHRPRILLGGPAQVLLLALRSR